jgi:hypothetical protein
MLTEIEKKQLERYQKQMNIPMWKYILFYGVIGWGITAAILVSVITMLLDRHSIRHMLEKELWINLIIFPIGGVFFGLYMRKFIPRQIKRLKEKEITGLQ